MPDHVHMCIAIPPKHPVASTWAGSTNIRGSNEVTGVAVPPVAGTL